ncbi:hypothetical protein WH50_05705 [Pokkaliibacter plantistimulans]|uniref:DUF416 domain-containing protein n=1 Tax=Pokkaliibacter plantistimulans TaxID=1635171 RepID=A0ABX5M153_9GAMM|nr:DUF416 family protein [Pokkaliibacter plantistimulans]PXF32222.1 hypothetical protein WH50_05705 [Pokkaliibacter plantistimulans]
MYQLDDLEQLLEQRPEWQRALFAVSMAERLFPNYALFARVAEFGDVAVLRNALDKTWDKLAGRRNVVHVEELLDELDSVTPDLREFDMYGAHAALDSCVALNTALNALESGEAADAASSAQVVQECIAGFVEFTAPNDDLSDEELVRLINTHELTQQQDEYVAWLLDELKQHTKVDAAWIDELRAAAVNEGVSAIGISDDE